MKRTLKTLVLGLTGALSLGVARAHLEVSAGVQIGAVADFYAPLSAQGAWIEVGSYGRCWHPAHVAAGWRPYCEGTWVWTDCGWYWQSDEPWAWACYHYGGWEWDSNYGWLWVPGIEWAPAWVSWRVGSGYIGWAPLGPGGAFVGTLAIGPPFVFVEVGHFHDRVRPSTVIVNNTTIINKTTVINNLRTETRQIRGAGPQRVMVNEGPSVAMVQKETGRQVQAVPIREVASKAAVPPSVKSRSTRGTPGVQEQPKAPPEHIGPTPGHEVRPPPSEVRPGPGHSPEPRDPLPVPRPKPTPPPEKVTPGHDRPPAEVRPGPGPSPEPRDPLPPPRPKPTPPPERHTPAPQNHPTVVPPHGGAPTVPHENGGRGEEGNHHKPKKKEGS
jgi:hypothetical protein